MLRKNLKNENQQNRNQIQIFISEKASFITDRVKTIKMGHLFFMQITLSFVPFQYSKYKEEMGAAQNNMNKFETNPQPNLLQSAPTPSKIDIHVQQDPLRNFLKQKDQKKVKIKTLTDIQKEAEKFNLKSKKISEITIQNSKKNVGQDHQCKQNNEHQSPVSTLRIKKETKENNYQNTLTKESKQTMNSSQKSDSKNDFKKLSFQTESFMKVRQQSPLLYYELQQMIGEGTFGQVFKAKCKKTHQIKAIKVLKTKFMKQKQMKGFLSQVTLQSKLNHPSIVNLCDLFRYQNIYYVVMEYCNGGSVVQLINKIVPKSEIIIANIMKQVFRALSYLHSLNIVHRDIKLQNIVFLNTSDSDKDYIPIKMIDFGAAVKSAYKVVQNYPIAGTMTYIAPEVLKGVLTQKSDLWSSGVLMYILLTGISPFKGKNQSQTKQNINKKQLNFNTYPLSCLSPQAKDLLEKLLNRNIYKRISANDALNHPWLSKIDTFHQINVTSLEKLETYYRGNNLISIIESYLALKKVTQEERQSLAKIFMSIDKDGNGLIQKQELINILKTQVSHFSRFSQQSIEAMVSSIDKNNSGKIDFNEFVIAMYDRDKLYVRQSLNEAFQYFDKDHTGFIEIDQLKSILHGGDAAQVEYFISTIDQDKDKRISREQFMSYLLSY